MNIMDELIRYQPKNEQETVDKKAMLTFIKRNDDSLLRSNLVGHFTSSAIIVNEDITKVLFAHHNIYNSWAWVGGHNDGNHDPLAVAIKEAKEETGLNRVTVLSKEIAGIDNIYVMAHRKNKKFVSDHIHFNITYILQASEEDEVTAKLDENSGVRWFTFDEIDDSINEPRMKPIYRKLFDVAKQLKKQVKR